MRELLSIKDLHVSFYLSKGELRAVRGASLSLFEGETLALAGESGCGKSVTARSILHLNPVSSKITKGEINLLGRDITTLSEKEMNSIRGKSVGMIFQDPMSSLNPSMRIWQQITDGLRKHKKMTAAQCRQEALNLLELVGLPEPEIRMNQYPHELSGGMRQRVMIAMALSCKPQILIADEPTTALDVTIQAEILSLLKSLKDKIGMSTLFITHDLAVAANTADRIAIMYAGRIVESGPVSAVFSAPAHPYTRALFLSHPSSCFGKDTELPYIAGSPPDLAREIRGCAFAERCPICLQICKENKPSETETEKGHRVCCFLSEANSLQTGGNNYG